MSYSTYSFVMIGNICIKCWGKYKLLDEVQSLISRLIASFAETPSEAARIPGLGSRTIPDFGRDFQLFNTSC